MTTFSVMQETDYHDAYALWTATAGMGLRSLDDSPNGIATFLARNPRTSFVARANGTLIATILCGHDQRRGYIYHTVVHPDHRGQGIGRTIVGHALSALSKEEIKKVALVVYADNEAGNRFWERLGFTIRPDLTYRNRTLDPANR